MEEFIDYVFLEEKIPNVPTIPLKILTGKYKDVKVCYGTIRVVEKHDETATLKFTYKIIEPSDKKSKKMLKKDVEFKNYLGRIIENVILENANENGTDNSEEPVEE